MGIIINEDSQCFHLQAKDTSYIIQIHDAGYPLHVYWGRKLHSSCTADDLIPHLKLQNNLDKLPQEYPQYGTGDFRNPAYQVELEDGSRITEFIYRRYRLLEGKPALEGLPATYVELASEAQTLELELQDAYSGLIMQLSYTVFADHNAIARSVRFCNKGLKTLQLQRVLSASVDFGRDHFEAVYLSGAWTREGHIQRRALGPGITRIESRRGASSHQLNPFIALVSPNTGEDQGDVYGFSLVYSGNFVIDAEVDSMHSTRVSIGINPFDFSWQLQPGECFQSPEAVLVYSANGLGEMSRTYHSLYRTRLCRGLYRYKERPILVNNWEATYFQFDVGKLEAIAKAAAELGIELFVLDDGWFGNRNDDTTSLGDWSEDFRKLPNGLPDLAARIQGLGLQFGLWVEPEMISPDSELYRRHPDWCLHVDGRRRTEARTQLVLDYSREEIVDYIFETLSSLFEKAQVNYVKWDMNRNMTEIGSVNRSPAQQKETAHRYILGLYRLLERLTARFPHILFENCASGGGRFDPGMLYYMPQTWTSDNTDAVERLKIQFGMSLVYPISAIGAHVSAVPNHQVGRITPLSTRGDVAMSGNFGYELDLTKLSKDEKGIVIQQVNQYKRFRHLVQTGNYYRLLSPFEGNDTSWMFVSNDRTEALVYYFKVLAEPNVPVKQLKLQGLDPTFTYRVSGTNLTITGDRLLHAGIQVPAMEGDFASGWIYLLASPRR
ncbi:alpha-galactosidase [Gordoniibacillus kamchatkensis]|uniref:Alpha-galactosidase n=1 Tax=Gordoniibacillus kamchatkensis TaxID=1590651 RepID=A0ABR5AEP9_9BACL|nr:alpha-galactosidase [Paenibacillus sp. VKM B-2647]KIL38877.1 alpha-galactosidase [Paenibacillus sp. VKM B-2647]